MLKNNWPLCLTIIAGYILILILLRFVYNFNFENELDVLTEEKAFPLSVKFKMVFELN